jgi:hypothetical protein
MTMPDGVGAADGRAQDQQSLVSEPDGRAEINGRTVSLRPEAQHEVPPLPLAHVDGRDGNVEHALAPLRNWRVGRATRHGVRGGATVGALIGGIVGTLLAPGVGTISFAYLGALAGAAVAGTAGWGFGMWRANRTTLQSLQQDVAPGTGKFDRLARSAGVKPVSLSDNAKERMGTTLSSILESRARLGERLTPRFVESVQTALIRLEGNEQLDADDRQRVCDRLSEALNGWAAAGIRIDAALVGRAVDALALARQAANEAMPKLPAAGSRRASAADVAQASRRLGTSMLGQDRGAQRRVDIEPFVSGRDWGRAMTALDSMMLERVRRGYRVTRADARGAATAFAQIARSGLEDHLKGPATADALDIMLRNDSLGAEALAQIALAAISASSLEVDAREMAMQALAAVIAGRGPGQGAIGRQFVSNTAQDCLAAATSLETAALDRNQDLDEDRRTAIRTLYREAIISAIKNGVPPAKDARRVLLEGLVAIQTSRVPDQQRAAALKTLVGAVNERLYLKKAVDADFVREAREAAMSAEAVLAQARLDQEPDLHAGAVTAIKRAYRQTVSTRLQVGRPMLQAELQQTLRTLRAGMRWSPPQEPDEIRNLGAVASNAADGLVRALLDQQTQETDLVKLLQLAYTSSARHTIARRALGLPSAAEQDARQPGRADPSDIRKDLGTRIQRAVAHRATDERAAQIAYERLMGADGKARALMVAADMLGSTHALKSQKPSHGLRASAELYGGLSARATAAREQQARERPELAIGHVGCLTMAMVALGKQAGARSEQDIEALHRAAARVFDPEQKAQAVLVQLWKQVPPQAAALTTFERFAHDNRENQRYLAALQMRVDPQAPALDEDDWKALAPAAQHDAPDPDAQRRALERARDAILDNWPDAQAQFTGVLHVTEGLGDAALLPEQAAGPQALPQLGGDVAVDTDMKRDDVGDDDGKDHEKKGDGNV